MTPFALPTVKLMHWTCGRELICVFWTKLTEVATAEIYQCLFSEVICQSKEIDGVVCFHSHPRNFEVIVTVHICTELHLYCPVLITLQLRQRPC